MMRIVLGLLVSIVFVWALKVGEVPPPVTISGDAGGKVSGGAWHSDEMKGKVAVLFYVDPDEKDLNEPFAQRLKEKHYKRKKVVSTAVVNMAATWKPNMIIEALLKRKQKKFPRAIYVKDKKKVLVEKWGLEDDSYDVLIFDRKGKVLYGKSGKMSPSEIEKAVFIIDRAK
jgi:predicted transcriptional regulator